MKLADDVIISVNESWLYIDFWPMVAYAYKTIFGIKPTLVFLTERLESDPFIEEMRTHGHVVLVRPVEGITQAAQTKMVRYWYAATREGVCYIDDIDEIPIDLNWHLKKVAAREPGTMLFVGSEVYGPNGGQCPASMMTGEGKLFQQLFNPDGLDFDVWIHTLKNRKADIYSRVYHEGMDCTTSAEAIGGQLFSDETFIAELRRERPIPESYVERGYQVGVNTIDRSYLPADINIIWHNLLEGRYLCAHTGRPFTTYLNVNSLIASYIQKRYEGPPLPKLLSRKPQVDPDMVFEGDLSKALFETACSAVEWSKEHLVVVVNVDNKMIDYLSRYFYVWAVVDNLEQANIYPAQYIYAPGLNIEAILEGLKHRRLVGKTCDLLITRGVPRADLLRERLKPTSYTEIL